MGDGSEVREGSRQLFGAVPLQLRKGPPIHSTGFGGGRSTGGLSAEAVSPKR